MTNASKIISSALFGTQGLLGPRFPTDTSPGGQYSRLRSHALTIQREQVGIPTPPPDSPVWAVLMETGHPKVTETLALVSDGTSSVYRSDGDGVIGGHGYENVRKAIRLFPTILKPLHSTQNSLTHTWSAGFFMSLRDLLAMQSTISNVFLRFQQIAQKEGLSKKN